MAQSGRARRCEVEDGSLAPPFVGCGGIIRRAAAGEKESGEAQRTHKRLWGPGSLLPHKRKEFLLISTQSSLRTCKAPDDPCRSSPHDRDYPQLHFLASATNTNDAINPQYPKPLGACFKSSALNCRACLRSHDHPRHPPACVEAIWVDCGAVAKPPKRHYHHPTSAAEDQTAANTSHLRGQ